jgi:hypothetical protein
MKRATGPGMIEARPALHASGERRVGQLLFNFDIDDAAVKPEHQQALEQDVLPLLAIRGARIRLRGTASRSGAASYNQQLSQRRVNAVRDFLIKNGAVLTQFDTSAAVGEDDAKAAGQADGSEDPRFRAVLVTVLIPISGQPVRFDHFDPNDHADGFDDTEAFQPPWIMVPFERRFNLVRVLNAQGLFLVSSNPSVVRVVRPFPPRREVRLATVDSQELRVEAGGMLGDAEIRVQDGVGNVFARLRVSVFERLTVPSAFHYVANTGVGTTRNVGDEVALLDVMNEVYRAQANIEFVKLPGTQGARVLRLTDNFGTEVNDLPTNSEFDKVRANRNRNARFNVFFVRELEGDAEGTLDASGRTTDTMDALATIGAPGDCVFEDSAGRDVGVTLAHEAGHTLGVRHASPVRTTREMLMWDFTDDRGRRLVRRQIEIMRRTARGTSP